MQFFDRMSNGWTLGMTSLTIIKENKSLLLFPILSSLALIVVVLSFMGGFYTLLGFNVDLFFRNMANGSEILLYILLFCFYLISYFVIVFFNMGLIHCASLIFENKQPTIRDGLNYAGSRISSIFAWAMLAATVGVILKILEDRVGWFGKVIVGIVGIVWSIATFFVVPVIAYENVDPIEAVKRSGEMMKKKWGETIGVNFSFGVFYLVGYLIIGVLSIALISLNVIFGSVVAILSALLLHTIVGAAKTVFIAATYNHMNDCPAGRFDDNEVLDGLFINKS